MQVKTGNSVIRQNPRQTTRRQRIGAHRFLQHADAGAVLQQFVHGSPVALGVAGSVMAVAWVVTGFLTNLLPTLGEAGLLLAGGISFLLSFVLMRAYGRSRGIAPADTSTHSQTSGLAG